MAGPRNFLEAMFGGLSGAAANAGQMFPQMAQQGRDNRYRQDMLRRQAMNDMFQNTLAQRNYDLNLDRFDQQRNDDYLNRMLQLQQYWDARKQQQFENNIATQAEARLGKNTDSLINSRKPSGAPTLFSQYNADKARFEGRQGDILSRANIMWGNKGYDPNTEIKTRAGLEYANQTAMGRRTDPGFFLGNLPSWLGGSDAEPDPDSSFLPLLQQYQAYDDSLSNAYNRTFSGGQGGGIDLSGMSDEELMQIIAGAK